MQFLSDYAHNYSLFPGAALSHQGVFLKNSDKMADSGGFI